MFEFISNNNIVEKILVFRKLEYNDIGRGKYVFLLYW